MLRKLLKPNLQAHPLLLALGNVRVLWLSQDPDAWGLSLPGSRVLHEAKEVTVGAPGREQPKQSACVPLGSMLMCPATV